MFGLLLTVWITTPQSIPAICPFIKVHVPDREFAFHSLKIAVAIQAIASVGVDNGRERSPLEIVAYLRAFNAIRCMCCLRVGSRSFDIVGSRFLSTQRVAEVAVQRYSRGFWMGVAIATPPITEIPFPHVAMRERKAVADCVGISE